MGKRHRMRGVWTCALAALVITACGGGGGGGGDVVTADLSGWWLVEGRGGGSPKPYEPFTIIQADDAGSSFWVNGQEFTRSGNTLQAFDPDALDPDREVITLVIVSANEMTGTVERYDRDVLDETTDLRITRRAAPSGTFSMTGTVSGQPVSVSSTTAYSALSEEASYSEFAIYHVVPYEHETYLEVRAEESPLQARTYTVGVGPGLIEARVETTESGEKVASGTVTLTSVGARLVGTYDLTMPSGAVTGSFDVDVLLPRLP